MLDWLTGTDIGKMCATFFISMLPVGELRAGLPYGIAQGLEYPLVGHGRLPFSPSVRF